MTDVAHFRLLTEEEYARLSTEDKIEYLRRAIEALYAPRLAASLPVLAPTAVRNFPTPK